MPFPISCQLCQAAFAIDEELFERRVAGKAVRFQCPVCKGHSLIDRARKGALETSAGQGLRRLAETDLVDDEADVAELSDDEVASLPPESIAAAKALRPKPKPRLESKVDDELWVVSVKEGVEDQEIFESSLIDLIATGKMPPDAIVWREGIDNWIPLADVPELAKHLPPPDDRTGGFLGTGMQLSFGSNAGERKSAPPPLPPKKRSYGNAKKKSYGGEGRAKPVALSPGFLFSVDDAESEPPQPLVEDAKKGGKVVPKPPLKAPKRAVTRDLDFSDIAEEEVIPSSGAPALRDLTLPIKVPEPSPPAPVAFFGALGAAEDEVLGPPSIDISDLGGAEAAVEQPRSEPEPPPEAAPSSPPASKKGSKGKSKRPPAPASAEASERAASEARSRAASEARSRAAADEAILPRVPEQRGWFTPGRIVVLLGIAALAYFLFSRQMQPPAATTTPAPPPTSLTREQPPEPAPVETSVPSPTPAAPEPSAPAEPAASVGAATSEPTAPHPAPATGAVEKPPVRGATSEAPPAGVKEETPKPEPKPEPKTELQPAPTPANPDAPPFNKDAAVAALNTAVAQAAGCRQEGDPSGTARVVVTFAPSGRVTSANLSGPPFAGTRTGGCIASTMRRAKIPLFSGSHVTVAKSVVIR